MIPHYQSTPKTDWDKYATLFGRSLRVTPGQIQNELFTLDGEIVVQLEDGNIAVDTNNSELWDVTTSPIVTDQIKDILESEFVLIP